METVLIDTNILIGRLRKEPRAMAALERCSGHTLVLCDAVVAEMLAGTRNKAEFAGTRRELFQQFHVLPFTVEVSQCFRDIVHQLTAAKDIHFADQLIAATAMAHDCSLLTLNKKHFALIKGLKLA